MATRHTFRPQNNLLQQKRVPVQSAEDKRRGERVNSRVRVLVEWELAGTEKSHEAHTRVVGPYGCLVVMPHNLDIEQRIRVTNPESRQTTPARVVWRGNERAEGWELGIELIEPNMNFWGLEL